MKIPINDFPFSEDPPPFSLKNLTVRILEPHEHQRAGQLLDQEHYLGDLPKGRCLLQVVEHRNHWVALLDWGPASLKLADREEWIGWTSQQRAQRLPLIAMNRRFLVLGSARMPNLASRALALATQALPEHWERLHGHRVVMAETFTDIEQFEGTCYKAAGWEPCGMTKGCARHRADFYQPHGRPKKLWMKSLNRNSKRIPTAIDVPPDYRHAINTGTPERDLPLLKGQLESLREHLRHNFKDPRRANRTYPASSLLAFIAMALMAGRSDLASIQRFGRFLTQRQRQWLDFPFRKGTKVRRCPSYKALWSFLSQIDADVFADCLSGWLSAHAGTLPRALAVDGKWVRDRALSLCLSDHETGAPVAVGFARTTPAGQEAKREGEQTVAKRLYAQTDLAEATITGDALFCDRPQTQAIIGAGGDYFFQIKNENRHAFQAALAKAEGTPLFLSPRSPTPATDASTSGT